MLVHPHINPIAFSIGPVSVHWYGIMYLIAFVLFIALGKYRIRRGRYPGWKTEDVDDMLLYGVLGVILGGRLGYVLFYQFSHYAAHPLEIFQVWHGGMSFHGGLIGVLIAMTLVAWRKHRAWFDISDFVAPLVPLGLAAGRLGNFINSELWGRPTDLPWGMIYPNVDNLPRHPSELYEFGLEGVALFIILWCFSRKPRPRGAVSGLFLVGYGVFRFLLEYVREPDRFMPPLPLGFTMGQWLSLPMVVIGAIILFVAYRKKAKA
jgi:phosphatidylglycerol:prolipoprotein diacylglycerol transferase